MARTRKALAAKLTASGVVGVSGAASFLVGVLLGTDTVNDVSFSIHDGTDNTGTELVPTTTYDASQYGLNGVMFPYRVNAPNGLYFNEVSGSGYECIIFYETVV
jgi:hypothetical protein